MRKAGLPMPAKLELGKKSFAQLQAEWYDKLEQSGHNDIEWYDEHTGKGQSSPYLKHTPTHSFAKRAPALFEYYRLCRAFLMHASWRGSGFLGDKVLWELHSEGVTYRKIRKHLNATFGTTYSLKHVFNRVNALKAKMVEWNRIHPDGLLSNQDDLYVDDVLIREPDPVPSAD